MEDFTMNNHVHLPFDGLRLCCVILDETVKFSHVCLLAFFF